MSKTVISVENLTKRYDLGVIGTGTLSRDLNRWWAKLRSKPDPYTRIGQRDHFERIGESILALDDVSFKVEQGEALGIIGKNGAGKSTLLKILSRVTAPTSGVVKVKGRMGSLLEVGTGFHPELTGRENVFLNGAILGMRKDEVEKKFDEIVDFSGVEQFIDTPVKRYSSGMYVRLAFAVAAHLDPEILIVDEVLSVGDAEFQKKCLGKMRDVTGQGRTVIFVSHNLGSVKKLCNLGLLLDHGKIIKNTKVEEVIDFYLERGNSELTPTLALPEKGYNIFNEELGRGIRLIFFSENDINNPKAEFKLWETWKIRFDFEIYKKLRHCIAAVGLNTTYGIPIITYWSIPQALQPGKYKAEFTCKLPLKACELTITVGLSELEKAFYYVENLGQIAISNVSKVEQPFRSFGGGLLLDKSDVKILRIS